MNNDWRFCYPSRLQRATMMRLRRRARAQQWMNARREPLRRALAQIWLDEQLAFIYLRHVLINYCFA